MDTSTTVVYNGRIEIGDRMPPRVTSVLNVIRKPYLEQWRGNVGNETADVVSRKATDLGTAVHTLIHTYNLTQTIPKYVPPRHAAYLSQYIKWFAATVKSVRLAEYGVHYSTPAVEYVGTCDLVVTTHDNETMLADIKTGKRISPEYALQIAAYRNALDAAGIHIDRAVVVRVNYDVLEVAEYYNQYEDYQAFEHAYHLYVYCKERGMLE